MCTPPHQRLSKEALPPLRCAPSFVMLLHGDLGDDYPRPFYVDSGELARVHHIAAHTSSSSFAIEPK
jgi:hypothetical protein